MIEPNARRRLQLIAATSRDAALVKDLRQVLGEDHTMSFVPSAELLRDVALCAACTQDAPRSGRAGLCDAHRARWNLEACMSRSSDAAEDASLDRLVHGVLQSPDGGAQLLSAFDRQRRALRLVLEAHARGAVCLPDSIARTVEHAAMSGPRFLNGGSRSAKQAVS
jgi:conjugal transfer/entry exclusion protein